MYLQLETHKTACVLRITTPRFAQPVVDAVREAAVAALSDEVGTYLIDLGQVMHMDSAALGVLINMMKRAGRDRNVELCALNPAVRKMLRLTRMDSVFRIHASVNDGLDSHFIPRARAI